MDPNRCPSADTTVTRSYSTRGLQEQPSGHCQVTRLSSAIVGPTNTGNRTPPGARPRLLTHEEVVALLRSAAFYPLEDPLVPKQAASLDTQDQALRDAMNKAGDEVQGQEVITQACYRGCENLQSGVLACMKACSVPFDNAQAAFNRACDALYAFERTNHCGVHCAGPN